MGISALARKATSTGIDVIPALEFSSPHRLLKRLIASNYTSVLFTWRFLLNDLLNSKVCSKSMDLLLSQSSVGFLVADHLGEDDEYFKKEIYMSTNVHFYLVTSEILALRYSESLISSKFGGIFHDLPNLGLISELAQRCIPKENRAIWVGNSQWGIRQKRIDHKGLKRVIHPLVELLKSSNNEIGLKIIDSSKEKLSNSEVLLEIARSKFLVQASLSEGTGLPVLEALALGTFPITTRVGIVPELLSDEFSSLICHSSADEFFRSINQLQTETFPKSLALAVESYFVKVKQEVIPATARSVTPLSRFQNSILRETYFLTRWKLRYFLRRMLKLNQAHHKRLNFN